MEIIEEENIGEIMEPLEEVQEENNGEIVEMEEENNIVPHEPENINGEIMEIGDQEENNIVPHHEPEINYPGLKALPFILGNEIFERLASSGLTLNFMVYFTRKLHMDQVSASYICNIWGGVSNCLPLVTAFISDAYVGKFWTIAFSSFASLLGMVTVTLTALIPELLPPPCTQHQLDLGRCIGPTHFQFGFLIMGIFLLSIGGAGIKSCSLPFSLEQFNPTTERGRKGLKTFFIWYYATIITAMAITHTIVVYIQDHGWWALGFGIPTMCMLISVILFFLGTKFFVRVKPKGSPFTSVMQVIVATNRKRRTELPMNGEVDGIYYDPPLEGVVLTRLPLTYQLRFLNKAARIEEVEVMPDGTRSDKWRLCSIRQVEEVKLILRVLPIWLNGFISLMPMLQQRAFIILQAQKMDRHLGPEFKIPAASVEVIALIPVGLWLPIYKYVVVPTLRNITTHETGFTLLQRIGIGMPFSILSMVVAGLVERMRRASPAIHATMSVMWLAPQLIIMGFFEAFSILGQLEFFTTQFPENMNIVGNAVFSLSYAIASYMNTLLMLIVHRVTGGHGRPGWFTDNLDASRLEYFYFLFAGMGVINLICFLYCARHCR